MNNARETLKRICNQDMSGQQSCYACDKEGNMKRCSRCQHAFYCSKSCQKRHWNRHKPNCLPPDSSLHELNSACWKDLFAGPLAARDYGFDNLRSYHGDVLLVNGLTAEHILLGLYQIIRRDIENIHRPMPGCQVLSSIEVSLKMLLDAYENNKLDDFIQRFIKSVYDNCGDSLNEGNYCSLWLQHKLVIGPTNMGSITQQQMQQLRSNIYLKYYGGHEDNVI